MKPARFDYFDPRSLEEALALLDRHDGDAKVIAGGQSLMPLLNMRLARPAVLVDLNRIEGSGYVRAWNGGVAIGMTARQRSLHRDPLVTARFPIMAEAALSIGHPQIRSRGTVCGSLAHADPAAEIPALALALDAEMIASSSKGQRTVPAAEFFVGFLTTALAPNEVLSEVRFPAPEPDMAWSFTEVSRRHGDFALVGAVAGLALDPDRAAIARARLVYFGVGPTPQRVADAERALVGQPPGDRAFADAGAVVSDQLDPEDDLHASAAYRRSVAGALTRRTLSQAWQKLAQ
ncbi:MAG TPA: xanthine dehydrogenase family protein subunit M [Chloroflexota bacterium]|nr:xanthine dehydrogenase family protein subunit M [Chloroflexota bacterium]